MSILGAEIFCVLLSTLSLSHVLFYEYIFNENSLPTIKGTAQVIDVKKLAQETDERGQHSVYIQELTITNENSNRSHLTTRYFLPFEGEINVTSKIAGGNKNSN